MFESADQWLLIKATLGSKQDFGLIKYLKVNREESQHHQYSEPSNYRQVLNQIVNKEMICEEHYVNQGTHRIFRSYIQNLLWAHMHEKFYMSECTSFLSLTPISRLIHRISD